MFISVGEREKAKLDGQSSDCRAACGAVRAGAAERARSPHRLLSIQKYQEYWKGGRVYLLPFTSIPEKNVRLFPFV